MKQKSDGNKIKKLKYQLKRFNGKQPETRNLEKQIQTLLNKK